MCSRDRAVNKIRPKSFPLIPDVLVAEYKKITVDK